MQMNDFNANKPQYIYAMKDKWTVQLLQNL